MSPGYFLIEVLGLRLAVRQAREKAKKYLLINRLYLVKKTKSAGFEVRCPKSGVTSDRKERSLLVQTGECLQPWLFTWAIVI